MSKPGLFHANVGIDVRIARKMAILTRLSVALSAMFAVFFVLGASPAMADDAVDCAQVQDMDRAIRACTQRIQTLESLQSGVITGLIAGGVFGDEALARAYNNRGNAYSRKANYRAALSDYNQAVSLSTHEALYYFNRGTAYGNLSDFVRAQSDFDQALTIRPQFPEALSSRALALINTGNPHRALQDAELALRIAPPSALSLYVRGRALGAIGRVEEAVVDLRKSLALDPTLSDSRETIRRLGFAP